MARNHGVDVFRIIAIFAVISGHSSPFPFEWDSATNGTYIYILLARFCVPFFFIIAGFYWGLKVVNQSLAIKAGLTVAQKLLILFGFWCVVYLLPYNLSMISEYGWLGPLKHSYWTLIWASNEPISFIFQGSRVHLWFMMALVCAVLITSLFVYFNLIRTLIVSAIALYVIGLLSSAYSTSAIGVDINFNTRNGPFFSTIFFVIGYLLSRCKVQENWFYKGLALTLVGITFQFLETFYIWRVLGQDPYQDYIASTLLLGSGVAIMVLGNHRYLSFPRLGKVGQYTLGIYAIHCIFTDALKTWDISMGNHLLWEILFVFIVYALSLTTVMLMARVPALVRFVK